jgi:2-oxoglutarate dehydrogenase E1 component
MSATFATRLNMDVLEEQYERWRRDPRSVDESWRVFFEGFELGQGREPVRVPARQPSADGIAGPSAVKQAAVIDLIDAYRSLGHLLARLDPLSDPPETHPLLEPANFGLAAADLDQTFDTSHFLGLQRGTLRQLIKALRDTYCGTIGVEYMHIQDTGMRRWLQERMEPRHNDPELPRRQRIRILMELHYAELFEKFLHTRYLGQKRFSLEGGETLIPILNALVESAADAGVREIVFGMAHRGRLNVLANVLGKPYRELFSEFEENYLPDSMAGDGDVKYHLGFSSDRVTAKGSPVHLSLTPNPSHLEAVNPVVEGRVRAKQHQHNDVERVKGMPLLIHGDAAVAGQGLVAETLNLSQLSGYRTGGTVHIVINNQIGFTTGPSDARSTRYCTDVAKMIEVPIFHVNAEDPEACLYLAELAVEFRQTFHKDVFIDLYCYRKHGHNEGDEPGFTQPLMVEKIKSHASLTEIYTDVLITRGDLTTEQTEAIAAEFQTKLHEAQEDVREEPHYAGMRGYAGRWKALVPNYSFNEVETGVPYEVLTKVADALARTPDDFHVHPKMAPIIQSRRSDVRDKKPIAWGLAESLAFGSLLLEGVPIRLSGQDSRRGTFSQRHAVLIDTKNERAYVPLQHLDAKQATFSVYDSLLSEAAVLGFEFGYALDSPDTLVLWEAQFGDFANGAQAIIDQFIVCSQSKWQRDSGLVMLLPQGYEGQGPEHSSARLERFLQLSAEDNIQVIYPTTPAQYFHLLRRQLHRDFRKPLVVMTPKSLLRSKLATSPIEAFIAGHFEEVLDDPAADRQRARRVVLCSGKIYYDLLEQRNKDEAAAALVRVEQLYPFPAEAIQHVVKQYPKARDVIWAQEESLNMGAWSFIEPRLRALGIKPKYVGRDASASPATGSRQVHLREQKEIVERALSGSAPHLVRSWPNRTAARLAGLEMEGLETTEHAQPAAS